jgi:hypothetical protein
MSKIDDYKRLKRHADGLLRLAQLSGGANQCDKFGAMVQLTDTHYGFYGNSDCTSWGDASIAAVRDSITRHWFFLITAAARKASDEAEAARKAAEAEAREVLELTQAGAQ